MLVDTSRQVAEALIQMGAIGFVVDKPITFKSGIIAPIYIDNRQLPFHLEEWKIVLDAFVQEIRQRKIQFEVVAGIETAGIPHSVALGLLQNKQSIYVRKAAKDHGTKKIIEGGDLHGKRVLLVEDHVTTGGSSLRGVAPLREQGAIVDYCLSITSYGLPEAVTAFKQNKVELVTLTTMKDILDAGVEMGKMREQDRRVVEDWLVNPREWGK